MELTPESPAGQLALPLGVSLQPANTDLSRRALEFLEQGPQTSQSLVEYVCRMPGAPKAVAEHLASALLKARPEFSRHPDGRWQLAPRPAAAEDRVGALVPTPAAHGDPLLSLSYSVVDVETTGGSAWFGHRITEFAAVRVQEGEIADVFETLVNPERPIPIWVTRLTRISTAMVQSAPRFETVAPRIVSALTGNVFVAHNATFDWGFITQEIHRATGERLTGPRLCTVKLARALKLHLRSHSLDYLANYYGVEIRARHRAGGDALATAQVLIRMLHAARDKGVDSFEALEKLTRRRGGRRRKRRAPGLPQPMDKDTTA